MHSDSVPTVTALSVMERTRSPMPWIGPTGIRATYTPTHILVESESHRTAERLTHAEWLAEHRGSMWREAGTADVA